MIVRNVRLHYSSSNQDQLSKSALECNWNNLNGHWNAQQYPVHSSACLGYASCNPALVWIAGVECYWYNVHRELLKKIMTCTILVPIAEPGLLVE